MCRTGWHVTVVNYFEECCLPFARNAFCCHLTSENILPRFPWTGHLFRMGIRELLGQASGEGHHLHASCSYVTNPEEGYHGGQC